MLHDYTVCVSLSGELLWLHFLLLNGVREIAEHSQTTFCERLGVKPMADRNGGGFFSFCFVCLFVLPSFIFILCSAMFLLFKNVLSCFSSSERTSNFQVRSFAGFSSLT